MKKVIVILALSASVLILPSCDANKILDKIKHKYKEFIGKGDKRGKRPFKVVYQSENGPKKVMVTSSCNYNSVSYLYYENPTVARSGYFRDTRNLISYPWSGKALKPYWDIRYVNPVSKYINGGNHPEYADHSVKTGLDARSGSKNIEIGTSFAQTNSDGSVAQAKCVNGALAAGTTINLFDAPEQSITYAGPQSTFAYRLASSSVTSPWNSNKRGNLMIQAHFDRPIYNNFSSNIGGGTYFNFIMRNKKNGKFLNYVIGVYATGDAWMKEKAGIRFDPTTGTVHVATVISDDSWWSTKSPASMPITEVFNTPNNKRNDDGVWNDFFRVNVSYQNLLAVLQELKKNPPQGAVGEDFGLNPEDWEITTMMIQYELEEQGGKAVYSGSFRGFEAYVTDLPM